MSEPLTFPCPLCDSEREIRATRYGKPYVTCESCGLQLFFRSQRSADILEKYLEDREHQERSNHG